MTTHEIFCILICHYLADFVFQSDWMAKNKAFRLSALVYHCLEYTFVVMLGLYVCNIIKNPYRDFILVSMLVLLFHSIVDSITSNINKYYADQQKYHEMFMVIGIDQIIHYMTIICLLKACNAN